MFRKMLALISAGLFLGASGSGAQEGALEAGTPGLPAVAYFPLSLEGCERHPYFDAAAGFADITIAYVRLGSPKASVKLRYATYGEETNAVEEVRATLAHYESLYAERHADLEVLDMNLAPTPQDAKLEGAVRGFVFQDRFFGEEQRVRLTLYAYSTAKRALVIRVTYAEEDYALLSPEVERLLARLRWADYLADF